MEHHHGHDHEHVKKTVKLYWTVFASLMVLTVLTVAVAYLHLPIFFAVAVALFIALCKGTLVAGHFMHLLHEKPLIHGVIWLTVFFFLVLLIIPVLSR